MEQVTSTRSRRPAASINITPLVDVLLIVMVVLMLCMPLFVKTLPVSLPKTGVAGAPQLAQNVEVSLSADGAIYLKGTKVPLETVLASVQAGVTVELAVDKAVPYEAFMKVAAAIQERGPQELTLLTQ